MSEPTVEGLEAWREDPDPDDIPAMLDAIESLTVQVRRLTGELNEARAALASVAIDVEKARAERDALRKVAEAARPVVEILSWRERKPKGYGALRCALKDVEAAGALPKGE